MTEKAVVAPINVEDVAWQEWSKGERFGSRVRPLSDRTGATHVGVIMEELAPGRQSCPFHYHMLEEEHLLALEGTATLRLGTERYALRQGDYVCFPAGQALGHTLINEGAAPFRFLMIGEKNANDVAVYPDSDKVSVRSLKLIYRKSSTLEYWEGETPPTA